MNLSQGGDFPHNPNNPGMGTIKLEPKASLSIEENNAAQAFMDKGYHVTGLCESNISGIQKTRTADLYVQEFGKVEVYSPKNTEPTSIVRNIEKKGQSSTFLIQAKISSDAMQTISNRIFGKPNCQHIIFLFFDPNTGEILVYKKN